MEGVLELGVGTAPFDLNIVFDFVHVRLWVHQDEALDEVRDEGLEPIWIGSLGT